VTTGLPKPATSYYFLLVNDDETFVVRFSQKKTRKLHRMKLKIFTTQFWKTVFNIRNPLPETSNKSPEQKPMSEEPPQAQTIQTSKPITSEETPKKFPSLMVRSELNLEQNSIFTVSTYKGKSREIIVKETTSTGQMSERRAIIGKTAGGVETGVLTTYHFKVYLALLELWEKAGRPIDQRVHFTILRLTKRLGMKDSGEEYKRLKRWLRDLRQIPLTFINSFYIPESAKHTDLADMTILNYLHIYERQNVGKTNKTRGYGQFRFDDHILENLINNHTHPIRLEVINDFKKHKDLAILLYTYLDRNLAFKPKYEIGLKKLFDHLDLSQKQIRYPSDRKAKLEPVLQQLRNKPLSTGTLSYCGIHKIERAKEYKLVCHKKHFTQELKEDGAKVQLILPTEPAFEQPESELLTVLTQKGLTQKQSEKLLSEKGEEVIRLQIEYFPFRLEEYKAQGKAIKQPALLYDSIKDNWQPPLSHLEAGKQKQKQIRLKALEAEQAERIEQVKVKAEEWAARSPEDRIAAPLKSWIWGRENFEHHTPTEEEIEAQRQELISNLPTKEEYEQRLIHEIERDIQAQK